MPQQVVKKINKYLKKECKLGGYKVTDLEEAQLNDFYVQLAKLINCHPRNISFAHDATDAYAKALSAIPFAPNDVIITTDDDYASNQIQFLLLQKRYQIKIVRIKNLANGDLDIADFEALVKEHTPKLVAVTHIPTNSGLIQEVEKIGAICEREDILFLLDACQSVGQIVVDVQQLKCDFLSVTGRKFLRGPRGTGFLYVSDKLLQAGYAPLFMDARGATWVGPNQIEVMDSAKRFETWERPYALVVGLKEAAKYANKIGMEEIVSYNQQLVQQLRANLKAIPNVSLYDRGTNTCNIITFRKAGKSLEDIQQHLNAAKVFYSVSTLDFGVIDFAKKGIDYAVRLSPHYFNTLEEMDKVAEIIEGI